MADNSKKTKGTGPGPGSGPVPGKLTITGEGPGLPVVLTSVAKDGNGTTTAQAKVDFSKAPAPTRKFVADSFEVRDEFGEARFIFGQRKVNGALRALLEVRYPHEPIAGLLQVIAKPAKVELTSLYSRAFDEEPEQSLAVQANFARANGGPSAATIDFYYASAFAIQSMIAQGVLHSEGVVRLQMPYPMLFEFHEALKVNFGHLAKSPK